MCQRFLAVPVRRDPRSGHVDLAVADPYDWHVADEFAFHLKTEVKVFRAKLATIEQALERLEAGARSGKVAVRASEPPAAPAAENRSPSGPPIPLVRRSARTAEGFVGGRSVALSEDEETIEVLGVRDIVEQMEGDGGITD